MYRRSVRIICFSLCDHLSKRLPASILSAHFKASKSQNLKWDLKIKKKKKRDSLFKRVCLLWSYFDTFMTLCVTNFGLYQMCTSVSSVYFI